MVFELFRLAGSGRGDGKGNHHGSNRHKGGELDEDTAVGWCVLPLADSRLRVVRGSFRIPMLRGEPNPNIDLHEGLEKLIASDLEAWLGNLYLDVRHLNREGRADCGVTGPGRIYDGYGGSPIGGEGYDIEYDQIRKVIRLGKGLWGQVKKIKNAEARWRSHRRHEREASDDFVGADQGQLDALVGYEGGGGGEAPVSNGKFGDEEAEWRAYDDLETGDMVHGEQNAMGGTRVGGADGGKEKKTDNDGAEQDGTTTEQQQTVVSDKAAAADTAAPSGGGSGKASGWNAWLSHKKEKRRAPANGKDQVRVQHVRGSERA